jgi:hypothetical protein
MRNQIIRINDDLLAVKYTANISYETAAKEWNALNENNRSFKQGNLMYFCELIEEANIIEEEFTNKQEE